MVWFSSNELVCFGTGFLVSFSYIFGFGLVQSGLVWFCFSSNSCLEFTIQFPSLITYFLIPNMSILAHICLKAWFWLYYWFWFGLVWLLFSCNTCFEVTIQIPSLSTCFFYAKHVTIYPKLVWNHGFSYIFNFGLVQYGMVWILFGSNNFLEVTIQFLSFSTCSLIPNMSLLSPKQSETMVSAIFLGFGLVASVLSIIIPRS